MARSWLRAALLAGWLGVTATAMAQGPPASGMPGTGPIPALPPLPEPGPGAQPAPYPGGMPFPGPPMPFGAPGLTECLPPNGFSGAPEPGLRPHHYYFGIEYLNWWVKKRQVPPLVTRGEFGDRVPGAAHEPGTDAFLGAGSADNNDHNGVRGLVFWWFDDDHTIGMDAAAWILEERSQFLKATSLGQVTDLPLGRPYFNTNTGRFDSDPVSLPGIQAGGVLVRLPRRLYGGDLNLRYAADEWPLSRVRWTLLAGVRYASMDEHLGVDQVMADLVGDGDPGIHAIVQDEFTTFNRYYGAQVGFESEMRLGPVFLALASKIGGGQTRQTIIIKGNTQVLEIVNGRQTVDPTKGFLTQPTNIGRYRRNSFSWMPETTLRLGVDFNSWISAWVGYNFLWWTDVLRPGDQIDTVINPQPIGVDAPYTGNMARPIVPFRSTDFWAQGISFGFLVNF